MVGEDTVYMEPFGVKVNDQPIEVKQGHLSQVQGSNGQILAMMYQLPSGAVRMFDPQRNIEIQYDGSAVKIRVYILFIDPYYIYMCTY